MKIEVQDVTKVYSSSEGTDVTALDGANASIRSGEFVTLVGPSGCGKTTLLDIVADLTQPTSGTVTLQRNGDGSARPGIIFQTPVLMPWRTALGNVLLPGELGQQPAESTNTRKRQLRDKAHDLLDLVGLGDFEGKYPNELSGGMQQRVAIARALLLESSLLLMDEPFSALDEFTREQMNVEVLRIWTERGFTTLFVTHNIFEAVFMSDRVLVMTPRPGRIIEDVRIDLPRPRDREMIGSDEFGAQVRKVRSALNAYWTEEQIEATTGADA